MSPPAVQIEGLVKDFAGHRALDGVNLRVEPGVVYGFLGRNGAGKTTTLRILLGLPSATSGSARVFGRDVAGSSADIHRAIGYLPDVPGYYPWMTGRELLRFCGGLFGLSGPGLEDRIDVLLDLAGLSDVSQRVGGYSRGMKQRLGIAQALVNTPQLLVLDEPTSALDPLGRKAVLEMITALRSRTTVLFSTHILADVERVCDVVGIIEQGVVAIEGPLPAIKARYRGAQRLLVQLTDLESDLQARLAGCSWASGTRSLADQGGHGLEVTVDDLGAAQLAIPRMVAELGVGLVRLEPREATLEEAFVDLVGGGAGA